MADIIKAIVGPVAGYLVGPIIHEGQYFFGVENKIKDLEKEKEDLTSERDWLQERVKQAKDSGQIIEKAVEKWLNDVTNILNEVADLEQRMEPDNSCFQGLCPTFRRYRLCKQMEEKMKAISEFKGKSNIQPFSHPAPLPGIQYELSENFIYFESTKVAYNQLMEALQDDCIYMIGVYGMGGSGKTTLVTEVGKMAEGLNLFDKVISFTVSQTLNVRYIQEKLADMLSLELKEGTEEGRAQRIWVSLKEKKRILIIVDDLWGDLKLRDVGICLDNDYKGRWKVLVTTRRQEICNAMGCQKRIHLGLLTEVESWTLFKKHANIDDVMFSKSMNDVPLKLCAECKGLPIAIAAVGSSLKGKSDAEWGVALDSLKHFEATDDHMDEGVKAALSCLKLSYDYLKNKETELLFLICSMFPEDYEISIEGLIRYAIGLGLGGSLSLESARSRIKASINKLLDSCLLMHVEERKDCVKMHDMVRDAALWIAVRSEDHKILVNLDKPLGSVVMDYSIRDYFAVSSWYREYQISLQLDATKLEILHLDVTGQDSLDLSHVTFEGIYSIKVFVVINQDYYTSPTLSLSQSIELLTNLRIVRFERCNLGDISFIISLTRLEILDLQSCTINGLPSEIGKLKRLMMLDLSHCFFQENYYGGIGECLQLEELYASGCVYNNISQMTEEVVTLPKLQRFVIYVFNTLRQSNIQRRVIELVKYDISNLRASKRNLLQIADVVYLSCFRGGCKNIIPDLIGVVGGMNNLSSLFLYKGVEIECIIDETSDSGLLGSLPMDALIPRLAEVHLSSLQNMKELCRGPTLHVLRFFEKLENLFIWDCHQLHSIFPLVCNLQNLKILILGNLQGSNCMLGEVLFSMSVAQSLQQLRQLTIIGFDALKHIIASGRENGSHTSEELIPTPRNSPSLMPNLKTFEIASCRKLKSLFPICCVEGLVKLQELTIEKTPELKYVFGECNHEDHSSHQYDNQIMLPDLKVLRFEDLENLVGMCPKSYPAKWPSLRTQTIEIVQTLMDGRSQRQQHPNDIRIYFKMKKLD